MAVPASRWQPSPRPFQTQPKEWDYPADLAVVRTAGPGYSRWRNRRWEIGRPFAGQWLGVAEVGDHAASPAKRFSFLTRTASGRGPHTVSVSSRSPFTKSACGEC